MYLQLLYYAPILRFYFNNTLIRLMIVCVLLIYLYFAINNSAI